MTVEVLICLMLDSLRLFGLFVPKFDCLAEPDVGEKYLGLVVVKYVVVPCVKVSQLEFLERCFFELKTLTPREFTKLRCLGDCTLLLCCI